jgi:hypothetical protein
MKEQVLALIKEKYPQYKIELDFLNTILINKKSTGVVIGNISFKGVPVEKQRKYIGQMADKLIQELIKRGFLKGK